MHKKIFALIVLDQITKLIFSSRDFFMGPIHFHPVKNFGLIGSLDFGTLLNLIITIVGLIIFIYYYRSVWIIAGALSNIFDRLYLGYVRDFIDLNLGFTFNLADAMIVLGVLLIFLFNMPIADEEQ